jgi:hypothetical protein
MTPPQICIRSSAFDFVDLALLVVRAADADAKISCNPDTAPEPFFYTVASAVAGFSESLAYGSCAPTWAWAAATSPLLKVPFAFTSLRKFDEMTDAPT